MIQAHQLGKLYGKGPSAVAALHELDFSIEKGERIAILGKSGSGKSTLMNLIGGLDTPTSGKLSVAGYELAQLRSNQLADFRLDCIGFVFQSFHLVPSLTVFQNVELPLLIARRSRAERKRRVAEVLESVGLEHRIDHLSTQLSGGERQRVAVARALVNQPKVLLADEPTGNLDSGNAAGVMELLFDHVRDRGMTLLLVTHDEELAKKYTGRILRMQDGRVV